MISADRAINVLACTCAEFIQRAAEIGISEPAALRLYRCAFRSGAADHPLLSIDAQPIAQRINENGTIKFTLAHGPDRFTESVVIPYRRGGETVRHCLCVSSQIGCAMGCAFCQTAQLGLLQQLTSADIVGQWFTARHELGVVINNIVFMGMGEPMENLDAVLWAIEILTDRNGAAIAPARITVSTVGRTAGILRLAQFAARSGMHGIKLAVSINAPNDDIRGRIMPINRAEPMDRLMDAMRQWHDRILIEYVLIPTVNDELQHADELADYLKPLRCTVNVIAYNPRRDSPWPAPSETRVQQFAARLRSNGLFVTCRRTTGRSAMAACGQLGTATSDHRRHGIVHARDDGPISTGIGSD